MGDIMAKRRDGRYRPDATPGTTEGIFGLSLFRSPPRRPTFGRPGFGRPGFSRPGFV
jgi:hypothetical protein